MKLAVLADIHANYPALQAVLADLDAWQPDAVVVAGDIVNRGPRPRPCLELMLARQRAAGWRLLYGNHEEYVLHQASPQAAVDGPEFELFQAARWTYQQLPDYIDVLAALPFQQTLTAPNGSEVRAVHASTRSTRDGIFVHTPDAVLREQIGQPPPGVLVVGHTHLPLVRRVDSTLVVNVGAVGVPFDGDTRAGYAQLTWTAAGWDARIVRLVYDHARALQDYVDTGFLQQAGPLARLMLLELQIARSQLYTFANTYNNAIRAGEISMKEAVERSLAG